jgi:hypothetical protein
VAIRLAKSEVYINDHDISRSVFSIDVEQKPGDIPTAVIRVPVHSITTTLDGENRMTIVYNLGRDTTDD